MENVSSYIVGHHHIGITVPNLNEAEDFYVGIFGFEVVWRRKFGLGTQSFNKLTEFADSAAALMMLRFGDLHLEFFQFSVPTAKSNPIDISFEGITHIALRVTDINQLYSRLSAVPNIRFHTEPIEQPSGNINTYLRDPFNNIIELIQIR